MPKASPSTAPVTPKVMADAIKVLRKLGVDVKRVPGDAQGRAASKGSI